MTLEFHKQDKIRLANFVLADSRFNIIVGRAKRASPHGAAKTGSKLIASSNHCWQAWNNWRDCGGHYELDQNSIL